MIKTEDLSAKLKKRLTLSDNQIQKIVNIITKYDLSLNIRNFDSQGLIIFDENKKRVRIVTDSIKDQTLIKFKNPKADVAIVYCNDLLAGWIEQDRLEIVDDLALIDAESLHKMPSSFRFIRECPHLDVYGGFTLDGDGWFCAGCKEKLVFNDS